MMVRWVAWCTRHHWFIIATALVVAAVCELARRSLPRDAIPNLSNPQVAVSVEWPRHSTTEVAEQVTTRLTAAFEGVPGSTAVRGSTMAGMAYVDVAFSDSATLTTGREALVERLEKLRIELPKTARIEVGPLASSTGWIYQYVLIDPTHRSSLLWMQHLQDNLIEPKLMEIPGVAEVASVGGTFQQALIQVSAERLGSRGLAFTDVLASVQPVADGNVDFAGLRFLPIENSHTPGDGPKTQLGDLATFQVTTDLLTGYSDFNGEQAALGGVVIAQYDADPAELIPEVEAALNGVRGDLTMANHPNEPATLELVTTYNRLDLVDRIGQTLKRALGEEVGVVVLVILIFLLHWRSALIPLVTLPFVLLLTFGAMWLLGVPATIMSLGGIGIALGMAVDAEVVALEACHRSLEGRDGASDEERQKAITRAAAQFAPAILTSLLIAALSFLPVFAFTGETGRLLGPLAITKTLVILAAAVVALTLAPALRHRLLKGRVRREFDNPITSRLVRWYRPFVHFALQRPLLTVATAVLAVASCVPASLRLGAEFLPRIDEGDLLYMPTTSAGVPKEEAAEQLTQQDRIIKQFKEVKSVHGKVGRADTPTDPAPFSMAETTIQLHSRSEWPTIPRQRWYSNWAPEWVKPALRPVWPERTPRSLDELVDELDQATRKMGWTNAWTAPVRARMDMLATGVHTPVGIRVVAANPHRLERVGTSLEKLAQHVPGARSAFFESVNGRQWPGYLANRWSPEHHNVDRAQLKRTVDFMLSGGELGEFKWNGDPIRLFLTHLSRDRDAEREPSTRTLHFLRDVTLRARGEEGQPIPLTMLGKPKAIAQPAMVRSEGGELVGYVYVDLEPGVDPAHFVDNAQAELERALDTSAVHLMEGERVEWTGEYELVAQGEGRLRWIVPFVLLSMFALLLLQFRSVAEAAIVLLSVPFALVGSIWTLYWLGIPLSAPVWVGLLSTIGLAMQTGVVMVVYIDEAFHRRVQKHQIHSRDDIVEAHTEGTVLRLRPKLMTICTMAAGLLPLLWAEGAGAEIIRRVAAPMLGGLLTSAFLTLEVIPVVYTMWRFHQLKVARRRGVPLAEVIGRVPAWCAQEAIPCTGPVLPPSLVGGQDSGHDRDRSKAV